MKAFHQNKTLPLTQWPPEPSWASSESAWIEQPRAIVEDRCPGHSPLASYFMHYNREYDFLSTTQRKSQDLM